MRLTLLIIFAIFPSSADVTHADTINVPADYLTIQNGIDAAANGDTVLVAPGTYVENVDFLGKAITLKSSNGAESTIIDGGRAGSVVTFRNGEDNDSVLKGFTITNGSAFAGGGLSCLNSSSPTIADNVIVGNSAVGLFHDGGGIFCHASSPRITNNIIMENWTNWYGGGICCYNSSPGIADNTILDNSAQWGGAIYCGDSSPVIENNTIAGNASGDDGGGIYCYLSSPEIMKNIISENSAAGFMADGGGICCHNSSPTITYNLVFGNSAEGISSSGVYGGGGIYCGNSSPSTHNNLVIGNSTNRYGGGICCNNSSPAGHNNTVIGNLAENGGGVCCYGSSPIITNTILWDNSAVMGPEIWIGDSCNPSNFTISYSDVQGGKFVIHVDPGCALVWGPGMIDVDPLFVDPADNDFHLTVNSSCRGSGDNSVPGLSDCDFEGDPRICQGTVDIGADEFHTHLYYTGDATPGGEVEGRLIGLPGTYPTGLWFGIAGVLDPPVQTQYGMWHLNHPWIQVWFLQSIPADGVLNIPATIPYYPAPYYIPMQALAGLNPDSLTNLCVLDVR